MKDKFQTALRAVRDAGQEVAGFGDDGLSRDEGPIQRFEGLAASEMVPLAPVQKRDKRPGVENDLSGQAGES